MLVNITAGDDLTMFEFQVVNEVIGEMAADSAEVIVGTALDPDMGDELRVTVVATGLGGNQKAQSFEDHEVVTPISRDGGGQVKYNDLEKPTYIRREKKARRLDDLSDLDIEVLDVPAFLRNQAD